MTVTANLRANRFAVSNVRAGTCVQVTYMQSPNCTQITCLIKALLYTLLREKPESTGPELNCHI